MNEGGYSYYACERISSFGRRARCGGHGGAEDLATVVLAQAAPGRGTSFSRREKAMQPREFFSNLLTLSEAQKIHTHVLDARLKWPGEEHHPLARRRPARPQASEQGVRFGDPGTCHRYARPAGRIQLRARRADTSPLMV